MRALALPALLLCLCACSEAPPPPATRVHSAPEVKQGRPAPVVEQSAPALDAVDIQLRTGRTRMGEAVRLHVSAWRASSGPSFSPTVEVIGPATVERVGEEIIEEQDGRVRERIDFVIEPSGPGEVGISVLATAPLGEQQRHELTLLVGEALPKAELDKLLATQSGRLERGRALAKQGDYKRAIEAFNLALEEQRDDPLVLGEVGWAAFLAGDYSLARRATREALRIQTDAEARGALLYNLGRIAEALKRDDEAIAAYRRSLAARPDSDPVRARLAKLEPHPTPICSGSGCPVTAPLDGIRACELIEEEGCPLFRQRGACSCDAEALPKLEAIGAWRLLTLSERDDEAGIHQVFFLLADAQHDGGEPRYQVFAPLPGSRVRGHLRGGVRAAELIASGETNLLRVDFEGTVEPSTPPDPEAKPPGLARGWTLLCALMAEARPVCVAPLLTRYETPSGARFEAPLTIGSDGTLRQTIESGTTPSRSELDAEFPGAAMQVITRPIALEALLAHAG